MIDYINMVKRGAQEIIESGQKHCLMLFVFSDKGMIIVDVIFNNACDKQHFAGALPKLLQQLKADFYVFLCEAWSTELSGNSPTLPKVMRGQVRVSELPPDDQQEILGLIAVKNGDYVEMWGAKIKEDSKGRYLGPWEKFTGEEPEGRFIVKKW